MSSRLAPLSKYCTRTSSDLNAPHLPTDKQIIQSLSVESGATVRGMSGYGMSKRLSKLTLVTGPRSQSLKLASNSW